MPGADLVPHRLGPFSGLDPRRIDDRAIQGTALRGGYNIEPVDAEWWSRRGTSLLFRTPLSEWFEFAVTYFGAGAQHNTFLVGHYACLQFTTAMTSFNVPYTRKTNENVTYTNGSAAVTTTTTRNQDEILMDGNTPYRIINVPASAAAVLDRPVTGTTGTRGTDIFDPIGASSTVTGLTRSSVIGATGCCFFRQFVSHLADDMWVGSPVVTKGATYLIVTTGQTGNFPGAGGAALSVVAIRVDASAALIKDLFRNTSNTTPNQISSAGSVVNPRYCCVFKDRLILAYAPDPNGDNKERTYWYSWPGDMLQWHTGVTSSDGLSGPNYVTFTEGEDRITGCAPLGDDLVIHRERSQQVIRQDSTSQMVFRVDRGFGCLAGRSLVIANGAHYFWSDAGPARFTGQAPEYISPELYRMLRNYDGLTAAPNMLTSNINNTNVVGIADPALCRIYFAFSEVLDPLSSIVTGSAILVYDWRTGAWWLEELDQVTGGGFTLRNRYTGRIVWCRYDGTVIVSGAVTGTGVAPGEDPAVSATADSVVVDSVAETPWLEFGDPYQKEVMKLELELRSINHENPFTKLSLTNVAESDNLYLGVDIFTDLAIDTARYTAEYTYKLSDFGTNLEGFRAEPRIVLKRPVRVRGERFKLRFKNALPASGQTASGVGVKKAPFRISQVTAWVNHGESDRRLSQTS